MPGIGVRTCARILTEVAGKHFASAAHLASYAGIAPVTRRSGTSIRGEHTSRRGNKKLKRALFLSAFAALHHPPSRGLLRPETGRRQTSQPSPHRPRPTPLRRTLRYAPRRNPLPGTRTTEPTLSSLTKTIEAPPGGSSHRRAVGCPGLRVRGLIETRPLHLSPHGVRSGKGPATLRRNVPLLCARQSGLAARQRQKCSATGAPSSYFRQYC